MTHHVGTAGIGKTLSSAAFARRRRSSATSIGCEGPTPSSDAHPAVRAAIDQQKCVSCISLYPRCAAETESGARSLQNNHEHHTGHGGRLGRSEIHTPWTEWPRPLSLVLARGPSRPLYVLLRVLRARVETPHPACISSRQSLRARPWNLRKVRSRYRRRRAQAALRTRDQSRFPARALGLAAQIAQESLGCRPYRAGNRRRRRV